MEEITSGPQLSQHYISSLLVFLNVLKIYSLPKCEVLHQNQEHVAFFWKWNSLIIFYKMWNHVSNSAKIIKISSV